MNQAQITFRDFPHSDAVDEHVRRRAAKLETFYRPITRCRVVLESPHRHHHHGKQYRVCICLSVPGEEIVIDHPNGNDRRYEDLHAAIDCAFDSAALALHSYARRKRDSRRAPPPEPALLRSDAEPVLA
jgi:ribosome-associated translation inhibitor RaiA